MTRQLKVVHMTSVHDSTDTRIYFKEARSLSNLGYEIYLVAPSSTNSCIREDNVTVITIKPAKSRFSRLLLLSLKVFHKAIGIRASIYHLHDPELIPFGIILKLLGKKVVLDIHENYPANVLMKEWIPRVLRPMVVLMMASAMIIGTKVFDGVVTANDELRALYSKFKDERNIVVAHNYPILDLALVNAESSPSRYNIKRILFLGGVTNARCFTEFIRALDLLVDISFEVLIGGVHNDPDLLIKSKNILASKNVKYLGRIPNEQIVPTMLSSSISINLFSDNPNHYDIRSNRLFESMLAGLPVLVSNFPDWQSFIKTYDCGISVDPHNPTEIASGIRALLSDSGLSLKYGSNGKKAVIENFSWESQVEAIDKLYQEVLSPSAGHNPEKIRYK